MTDDANKVDHWMPLWIGRYLADTMHLRAAEHGAYLLLIMHHWRKGPIPDDDESLATIARMGAIEWKKARPKIQAFFRMVDGCWVQNTAVELKEAAAANKSSISQIRSGAGKKGAAARWQRDSDASDLPSALPSKNDGKRMAKNDSTTSTSTLDSKGKAAAESSPPQGPVDKSQPPPPFGDEGNPETRARAVRIAGLLSGAGVQSNPLQNAVVAMAGNPAITDELLGETLAELARRGKPFGAGLVAIKAGELLNPKNRYRGPEVEFPEWNDDDDQCNALAKTLGMQANGNEGWPQFRARIRARLRELREEAIAA